MIPARHSLCGAALALALAAPLAGQDTTVAIPPAAVPATADSAAPPISPMGAFLRSLVLPGWGQAKLGRRLTGGIFIAWEGVTLGMTVKTSRELTYLRRTGSARVEDKQRERQDWITLLVFNHLMAGLEAYVSAHLWDFPGDIRIRAAPDGLGAAVSLPIRLP